MNSSFFIELPRPDSYTLYSNSDTRYFMNMLSDEWTELERSTSSTTGDERRSVSIQDLLQRVPSTLLFDTASITFAVVVRDNNDDDTPVAVGLTDTELTDNTVKVIIQSPIECHICLDTLLPGSCLRAINACGHSFCIDCIDPWLRTRRSCPVCKQAVC